MRLSAALKRENGKIIAAYVVCTVGCLTLHTLGSLHSHLGVASMSVLFHELKCLNGSVVRCFGFHLNCESMFHILNPRIKFGGLGSKDTGNHSSRFQGIEFIA